MNRSAALVIAALGLAPAPDAFGWGAVSWSCRWSRGSWSLWPRGSVCGRY